MKTVGMMTGNLKDIPEAARTLEAQGADVGATLELGHDPTLQLALAAAATKKMELMTSIVVALARSPMTLALAGHDINSLSGGRLTLGLGSQIKPHIEKRYSMPWSKPASRMREYVLALKAIWASWYDGEPLNFRGEFYQHTLMTPMFTPPDIAFGAPDVVVAGVGPMMSENGAEVADGLLLHAFSTEEYVRTVQLPAVERGLAKAGRDRADFRIIGSPFIVSGNTEEEFNKIKTAVCKQLAFYGSTPAYRGVLESVGYGELQGELNRLSKAGEWDEMGRQIDDTLLSKIAFVGDTKQVATAIQQRYGDVFDSCVVGMFTTDAYTDGHYSTELGDMLKAVVRT